MKKEFEIPDFLQGESYEEIMSRMLKKLPDNIGKEENGWICDIFSPVAIEHSRAIQFALLEAVKNIIPKYSYGDILLGHAENRGIFQKKASYATAIIKVSGIAGTVIPYGFQFSTAATLTEAGVVFSAIEEAVIGESGTADVKVQCQIEGRKGNVASETIILMVKPLKGITSVSNEQPAYGGFEDETDESIRQRIADFDLAQGASFVGSYADYKRWAEEVNGVGSARIISAKDNSGTVKIILIDSNGNPAENTLCEAVENYIMRPDAVYERLAPINAILNVVPAETMPFTISADVILSEGFDINNVVSEFTKSFNNYIKNESRETVKYSEVGSLLINTNGVSDYDNMLLNGQTENVHINEGDIPVIEEDGVVFNV